MLPIDFPEANMTLTKPESMTDAECMSVRALRDVDIQGFPFFLIMLQPSKEDCEAIAAGRPILLKVVGDLFPPVALYTYDENNKANV